jgi:high-affinity K+ transport system ATPase subunit B
MITRIIAAIVIVIIMTLCGSTLINKCVHIIEKTPVREKTMKLIILLIVTSMISAILVLLVSALMMV